MMSIRLNGAAGPLAALVAFLPAASASAQTRLLRFPDIPGDRVVFSYAGDLWSAPARGGGDPPDRPSGARDVPEVLAGRQVDRLHRAVRRRRTGVRDPVRRRRAAAAHVLSGPRALHAALGLRQPGPGLDSGRQRDPLPLAPRRDGLRPRRASTPCRWTAASPRPLPMPLSGAGDFSPDGKRLVYSPLFRDFRTWKRYQGGWAQDLYLFDLATTRSKHITSRRRTERDPMWIGDAIYFASDRTGTLNLYALRPGDGRGHAGHRSTRPGTCAGRRSDDARASSTSWAASSRCSTSARRRPGDRDRRAERRASAPAVAGLGREEDRGLRRSRPRASASSSSRAATCSRRRSRRARPAT